MNISRLGRRPFIVKQSHAAASIVRQAFDPREDWADPGFLNQVLKELKLGGFWKPTTAAGARVATQ